VEEPGHREQIAQLTGVILDPVLHPGRCRDAALALLRTFLEVSPLRDEHGAADTTPAMLPAGKAISAVDAGRCIEDFMRTRVFLRAVDEAVADRRAAHPDRPVRILYAGTGPFATLVTPLLLRWPQDAVQVLCLEVHDVSAAALERLIDRLDLGGSVLGIARVDATTFAVPEPERFDILLTETMQRGLEKEPQVAIVQHLLPQLRPDVTLIPDEVRLSLSYVDLRIDRADLDEDPARRRDDQGVVYTLSAAGVRAARGLADAAPIVVEIRRTPGPGESLLLTTDIDVYRDHALRLNESGLTLPTKVRVPAQAGTVVAASYVVGETPHLELTVR
jgi:predicted RNA methylase